MPDDLIKVIDAKIALLDAIESKDEELIAKYQTEYDELNTKVQEKLKNMSADDKKINLTDNDITNLITNIDERIDKLNE